MRNNDQSYRFFIEGLIRQLPNPKIILEIGLGSDGYTAQGILEIIKGTNSKYYTIEKTPNPIALKNLECFSNYEIIENDSANQDSFSKFSDGINQCDMVLIDGDHTSNHVFSDICSCVTNNVLKPNGLYVFHDANSSAIRYALNKASKEFDLSYFIIPNSNIAIAKYRL